jgi:hypothetical protein
MKLVLIIFLSSVPMLSYADSIPQCQPLNANTSGLSQSNTLVPASGALSLSQATAVLNDYFSTWNKGAYNSQVAAINGKPFPSKADVDDIGNLYTADDVITHHDIGIGAGKNPDLVFQGADQTRNMFVTFFLSKQPGSIHKPEYICVNGNAVTVGLRYFVPKKGTFLDPKNPATDKNLAVSVYLVGNYIVENKQIKSLQIPYDFTWLGIQSAMNGVPVQ